nr:hypothetical protein Iba_chr05fCG16320 [Ipomoea batatas]
MCYHYVMQLESDAHYHLSVKEPSVLLTFDSSLAESAFPASFSRGWNLAIFNWFAHKIFFFLGVQLSDKTGEVVVLEVFGQNIFSEPRHIPNHETLVALTPRNHCIGRRIIHHGICLTQKRRWRVRDRLSTGALVNSDHVSRTILRKISHSVLTNQIQAWVNLQSAKSEAQGDWLRGQFALQLEIQAWVKEAQRDRRRGSTGVQTSRAKKICGKAAPAFAQAK